MMRRDEFESTLSNPLSYWSSKSKNEVGDLINSKVGDMVGFDQRSPHHCYDLFNHSLHTVDGIVDPAPILLRVAAFFHDIGKPVVAMEKQGRLVFYGHAQKSAEMIPDTLKKMGYVTEELKEICFYIKHHDDFISWILPEEENNYANKYMVKITEENIRRHIDVVNKKCSKDNFYPDKYIWKNLLNLCYADVSAQAEVVFQNGTIIDTQAHKLKKISTLQTSLN